jgi:ParB family chromosome partitioning protein
MTTTAAEKLAGHAVQKKEEKRRALGRGLESLLPGPRVVVQPSAVSPQPSAQDATAAGPNLAGAGGAGGETRVPRFARDDREYRDSGGETAGAEDLAATRTGASALHEPELDDVAPGEVISIQAVAETRVAGNVVANIPIELIGKNPYQTRFVFDEDMLRELAESIREHGVVQPVVVRPAEKDGRYILVLGERRLRASKLAGKDTIPAIVRKVSLQQAAEMTVLENVVREDLNPIEQAQAFKVLSQEFKLTQAQIAERIGVSRESVSNYMRLLRLPEEVTVQVAHGRVSFSEARELLALENPEHILVVLTELLLKSHTLDEIAERVRRLNESAIPGAGAKRGTARWVDPNVRAAQLDMERTLGMRVRIADRNGKGKIVIEYASVDDYERVTAMLRGKQ